MSKGQIVKKKTRVLASNRSLALTIALDISDMDTIFMELDSTLKFTRKSFLAYLNFLKLTSRNMTAVDEKKQKCPSCKGEGRLVSPKSMSDIGYVWLFDDGHVKIKIGDYEKTFPKKGFENFFDTIITAEAELEKLETYKKMTRAQRRELGIDEMGDRLPETDSLYVFRKLFYGTLFFFFVVSLMLLAAALFSPILFRAVFTIWGIILLILVLLPGAEKERLKTGWQNLRDYVEEDYLLEQSHIQISRKTVELFVVLTIVSIFMIAYFSKALPVIMDFWKTYFTGGIPVLY